MSGIGGDPDEYTPGNQPDGSYYDPFPESSQPGLFGGMYADMQANAPRMANPDLSDDGTGLPPSVTVALYLPQLADATSVGNYQAPNIVDATSTAAPGPNTAGNSDAVTGYDLPGVGQTYFDPEFARRLDDFRQRAQADGIPLAFVSGYRTPGRQQQLHSDPTATAPAEHSLHSTGDAVDIHSNVWNNLDSATRRKLVEEAGKAGLSWGGLFKGQGTDPRHFYYDPGGNRAQRIKDFGDSVQAFKNGQGQ